MELLLMCIDHVDFIRVNRLFAAFARLSHGPSFSPISSRESFMY